MQLVTGKGIYEGKMRLKRTASQRSLRRVSRLYICLLTPVIILKTEIIIARVFYPFARLAIKYILVNDMILVDKGSKVIKTFYTAFNFLKAIRFNDNEGIVLFQTGNLDKVPRYGNSGKDSGQPDQYH